MKQRGNPHARQAGAVVRAVLLGLVGQKPMPLTAVMELTGRSRTRVLDHLAILQERKRIAGYTTRGGIVRVWTEERE